MPPISGTGKMWFEESCVDLSVSIDRHGELSVATIHGDVDANSAPQLRTYLDAEIVAGCRFMVVDLTGVGFLDSSGLGVLIGKVKRVRNVGGWLRVVCSEDRVLRVFSITGLDKVIDIVPTMDQALPEAISAD
jgi:anti-sigma B factor antagonist